MLSVECFDVSRQMKIIKCDDTQKMNIFKDEFKFKRKFSTLLLVNFRTNFSCLKSFVPEFLFAPIIIVNPSFLGLPPASSSINTLM